MGKVAYLLLPSGTQTLFLLFTLLSSLFWSLQDLKMAAVVPDLVSASQTGKREKGVKGQRAKA